MNIVFAHFNSPLPKHLVENLRRSVEVFPDRSVYLITDLQAPGINVPKLNIFHLKKSDQWTRLENLLAHPKSFRHNFSLTSTARFLSLADFSLSVPGELLHVESDVVLSPDFPFFAISKYGSKISFPIVNHELGIASILYLRDSEAAEFLARRTLQAASENPMTTDMHILSEISKIQGGYFQLLPTCPSDRIVQPNSPDDFLRENSKAIQKFHSFFDGGDLGRYLFGDDPRNWGGRPPVRHNPSNTFYSIRNITLSIDDTRTFPFILNRRGNQKIPIHTLHVHSKEPKIFTEKKQAKIIRKAVRNADRPMRHRFFPLHFCRTIIKRLAKENFFIDT